VRLAHPAKRRSDREGRFLARTAHRGPAASAQAATATPALPVLAATTVSAPTWRPRLTAALASPGLERPGSAGHSSGPPDAKQLPVVDAKH